MSVVSASRQERPSPDRPSPSKKLSALNPLRFLKSKNNYVGQYDCFSDDDSLHSDSFEDLPLGIHGRGGWSYSFDSDDFDDDDDDLIQQGRPSSSSHAQIFFHTTFDDTKEYDDDHGGTVVPIPCARERHMSALEPTTIRPLSPPPYASQYMSRAKAARQGMSPTTRAYEADSDTSGTVDTDDDEYDDPTFPKKRTIRFADEAGKDLQTIHITERDKDDADEHLYHMRMIVLLLNPKKKQFEFLHLTTPREERTHILQAVRLFPSLASDVTFGKQKYVGMCRPMKGGQEFINSLCLQDYDIDRDEILVAIPKGMKSREICKISNPLLHDRNVQKMVKRKMRSGFAVQSLPYALEQATKRDQQEEEKGGEEDALEGSVEQTTQETRLKKEDAELVQLGGNPVEDPVETRQNSDGSDDETSAEENRSEADGASAPECYDDLHEEEASEIETEKTGNDDAASKVAQDDDVSASTASTSSSSVKITSLATGVMQASKEDSKHDEGEMKDDEVDATIASTSGSVKVMAEQDDDKNEMGNCAEVASVSALSTGSSEKSTLMAVESQGDRNSRTEEKDIVQDGNNKTEEKDMVQDDISASASSTSSPARATSMATGFMVAQGDVKVEDTEQDQSDEALQLTSSIGTALKALLTVSSGVVARDDEVCSSRDGEPNDDELKASSSVGSAVKALVTTISSSLADQDDGNALLAIDRELLGNDEASTSTSSTDSAAKAMLKAAAVATEHVDESSESTDEMKEITRFIDELQQSISTELESVIANKDSKGAFPAEDSRHSDDEDVGALFAPVEHALNDALQAFHASAVESDSHEAMPDPLNVSMETRADGLAGTSNAALSLAEAIVMVSSDGEEVLTGPTVSAAVGSFRPSTEEAVDIDSDNAASDADMNTVGSSNAAVNESVDEDGFPLPLNDSTVAPMSTGSVSPDIEMVAETATPSGSVEDESAHDCDPVPVLEDIAQDISPGDHEVFADSVASTDGEGDYVNDGDFSLHSYSTSDEDEDHVEGHDSAGAFPVAKSAIPSVGDIGEEEADDVSENDTSSPEPAKPLSPSIKSKGKVSLVNIHSKHIASGSFCPSPKRSQVNPSDDVMEEVPNMDENVVVEVDELRSDEEEKKKRFILYQIWSATVLVAVGFFLRTLRRRKKKRAEF